LRTKLCAFSVSGHIGLRASDYTDTMLTFAFAHQPHVQYDSCRDISSRISAWDFRTDFNPFSTDAAASRPTVVILKPELQPPASLVAIVSFDQGDSLLLRQRGRAMLENYLLGLKFNLLPFLIFIPVEHLLAVRPQKILRRGFLTDIAFLLFNVWPIVVGLLCFSLLGALVAAWIVPASLQHMVGDLPYWAQVPLIVLLADLGIYWTHRMMHEYPMLWRVHAVHHSVEDLDWLAAAHQHPLDVILIKGASLLPVLALGFSEEATGTYVLLLYWQSFLSHANVRINFGPLRYVLVSPEFHHWHHSSEREARDRNFAAHFAFIDLLFGSLHLPKGQRAQTFGVDHPMPRGYLRLLAYPFIAWRQMQRAGTQEARIDHPCQHRLPL
jgi:sterol desaturase/sphingolipid hydroxylase (fatty acid hydroxylase superfamily)